MLLDDGWVIVRQRGSHRQFRHPEKPGTVTVAGHPNDDLLPRTWKSILKQAQLERIR
ncbi:MAG: type II toxin-antitoxin system HicA family toxin [Candidatus Aquilonibacter sp.]